jgi:hypothetical protein
MESISTSCLSPGVRMLYCSTGLGRGTRLTCVAGCIVPLGLPFIPLISKRQPCSDHKEKDQRNSHPTPTSPRYTHGTSTSPKCWRHCSYRVTGVPGDSAVLGCEGAHLVRSAQIRSSDAETSGTRRVIRNRMGASLTREKGSMTATLSASKPSLLIRLRSHLSHKAQKSPALVKRDLSISSLSRQGPRTEWRSIPSIPPR